MPSEQMGKRLKQLRERAGLTQREAAARAGVPIASLRNWEYGRREPLLSAAGRLATALGVSIDALLEMPEEKPAVKRPSRKRKPDSESGS